MAQPSLQTWSSGTSANCSRMKGVDVPVAAPVAADLGIIKRGEVAVKTGRFSTWTRMAVSYAVGLQTMIIDAENKVVCPGLWTPIPTPFLPARVRKSSSLRLQGKSYAVASGRRRRYCEDRARDAHG